MSLGRHVCVLVRVNLTKYAAASRVVRYSLIWYEGPSCHENDDRDQWICELLPQLLPLRFLYM